MPINEARRILAVAEPIVGVRTTDAAIKRLMRRFGWSEGKAAVSYETAKATADAEDLKKTIRRLNELADTYHTTAEAMLKAYA